MRGRVVTAVAAAGAAAAAAPANGVVVGMESVRSEVVVGVVKCAGWG